MATYCTWSRTCDQSFFSSPDHKEQRYKVKLSAHKSAYSTTASSLSMWVTHQWILCITACSTDDHDEEKRTEQKLIVRSGKSETEVPVANNRRLRSTYRTIEANYWQTQSIARPLCDSMATCYSVRSWRIYLPLNYLLRVTIICTFHFLSRVSILTRDIDIAISRPGLRLA